MTTTIFAVLSTIGSVASLVGLIIDVYRKRDGIKTYSLTLILLLLAGLSGYLWSEANNIRTENIILKSAREDAKKLVSSWPDTKRIEFVSRGEARGIVLSGLAFLETHKEQFPDTYQQTSYSTKELGINKNNDKEWYTEIGQLQQAAETMAILISSIQVK